MVKTPRVVSFCYFGGLYITGKPSIFKGKLLTVVNPLAVEKMTRLRDQYPGISADDISRDGQEQPERGEARLVDAGDYGGGRRPADIGLAGGDEKEHGHAPK